VSSTQVDVILTATDLGTPGSLTLMAVNPAPAGGSSGAASVAVNNPIPGTITLSPSTVLTGATTPTTVTVTGTGFLPSSMVQVNGSNRATTYTSATQLSFQLTVTDQSVSANLNVAVVNGAPGGGTSPVARLLVTAPTPTPVLSSINPTQFVVNSGATSLAVFGSNLTADQTVEWNGTPLVTYLYNNGYPGSYLVGIVPANLLTATGTASITVSSPASTPVLSNALTLSIVDPPAPTLTSITPAAGPFNQATTLTLTGSGYSTASTVSLNGKQIDSTFNNSSSITVKLTAADLPLPGNQSFTVTTPAPGGGTTDALTYTAYIGIVNNSAVYDSTKGLFYVSVPSSAGAPYGNSIVSVDPETGALGTPIPVGAEPNKLAISSDGTFLWVGLDGASAVRKVDLTTNTAGLQFTLGGNNGIYQAPGTAVALAALPGAPDSVVVQASNASLSIYDSGVLRGTNSAYGFNPASALLVDGSKSEVYAAGQSGYQTFTYNSSGLTSLATNNSGTAFANYSSDEIQIAGGRVYTDFGRVADAESGALLGTFYTSGTNVASGTTAVDSALGKAFVLDYSQSYSYVYNQIQIFNTADFTSTASVIPVSLDNSSSSVLNSTPSRMTRWGTNGLAFRTPSGIYSLRSSLVKDLSSVSADLSVTLTTSGTTTGANTTYVATVKNAGPAAATNIALLVSVPATGVLSSITASAGTCSTSNGLSCNLGGLASGATATVSIVVQQTTPGSSTLTAQVNGSETDPDLTNNQATSTVTVTGAAYNLPPVIAGITPSVIEAGATDTVITVNGSGFSSSSVVQLAGTALSTTFTSPTVLTATVPAAQLAALGWSPVTIVNPTPGGGTSNPLPLSIFKVLTVGLNHIVYEPFSRLIYAAVGSGSSSITGNSIAPITPETGTVGTPVYVGSQPSKMAISDDGNILYALLTGANSVARFNLQTQKTEFTFSPPVTNYGSPTNGFRDVAVQTGAENTIVVDFGYTSGMGIIDVDPTAQTGTLRGASTGLYTGTSLHFYDPNTLYLFNTDTWQTLDRYAITSSGFSFNSSHGSSTLQSFGTFRLVGKVGFADAGGVADVTTTPATQLGVFKPVSQSVYIGNQVVAPDTSLSRVFFMTQTGSSASSYNSGPDGVVVYDPNTFMPVGTLPLNMPTIEGTTSSYTGVDLVRWGQDGLAALTSGGHLYLLRGAAVVPGELTANSAATLTSISSSTIAHGAGNTLLTLSGSNFLPGVAVEWNGSYRTTTIVDGTHLTVAIPASDLATAGSASLTAVNPGAAASSALTVTIN
jgi:sugar lactone lactonase YvrE